MPPPRLFAALGLFVREQFLDRDLRQRVLAIAQGEVGAPATIVTTRAGGPLNPSIRRAWEIELPGPVHDELGARIDRLRPALEEGFGVRLGASEGWSALKYPPGAFYRPHRDRHAEATGDISHRRAVSIVVFVNDGHEASAPFTGGALRFYDLLDDARAVDVGLDLTPEAGTLVAFDASQLHEVTPVESGERYSLVTWLAGAG